MATLYGTSLRLDTRTAQCAVLLFLPGPVLPAGGQVWLHQSVEVCGVSRHPGHSSRKYRTSTSFTSCSARNWFQHQRCRSGTTARSRAPGRHLTSAATSSRFHGFPLTNFRPDGFQYINHFKRGQCSFCTFVPALVPARSIACSMLSVVRTQKQPEFRCPGQHAPGRCLHHSDIFKVGSATTNNRTQRNHPSYLPVLASAPAASGSS